MYVFKNNNNLINPSNSHHYNIKMHKIIFEKTAQYVDCSFINFYLSKLKTMMRSYEQNLKKDLKIGMMSRVFNI